MTLLAESGVGRYLEFKAIEQLALIDRDGTFQQVGAIQYVPVLIKSNIGQSRFHRQRKVSFQIPHSLSLINAKS